MRNCGVRRSRTNRNHSADSGTIRSELLIPSAHCQREGGFAGRWIIEQNTSFVPFRGWREPQAGRLFLCAGVGGRRPSPPQRASTSCAPPPPEGEGDGRGKGRGLRAEAPGEEGPGSGQARRGTGQSPHAPEAGPPEHRPRGTAQGPPRGEWRAAPPVGRWPARGAAEAAATAQERPASGPAGGAGRRQRTPANGGGCPCAPPCSPRRRPPEGASTGQAGHGAGARAEGAAARRARSCGPPTPRCKEHHPQGTASGAKGKRPGRGLDASGKENSWQSQPLAGLSYHSGGAAVKPPKGAAPYLILGHYSVRGAP